MPYFLIDSDRLETNLQILSGVMQRTGCKILLAQKCFSCYALYPQIAKHLAGATASGLYEARLCSEEMPDRENHIFSPAFQDKDMDEILHLCDHIVFNSPRQFLLYGEIKVLLTYCNPLFSPQSFHIYVVIFFVI